MEIRIFDVEHGFCAYVIADNGNVILIDCGHNEQTGFRPSRYLLDNSCSGIEKLIISNYDEDHLSDLPNLKRHLPIDILHRNPSISKEQLVRLKQVGGPLGAGLQALLDLIGAYTSDVTTPPDFAGIELKSFWNVYPHFQDTNNLSLITFLHYRDIHIIFPGDLEKLGWHALLQRQSFRDQLRSVNIFVASHHGRESGYCEDVFFYCKPEVILISDESIKYDTQIFDYSRHASGIQWGAVGKRYVLSTRNDGMITISQKPGTEAFINTAK